MKSRGFTLVELLVVFSILALLVSIAVPRYFGSLEKSKEAVLKQNLAQMREAIDKFYGDRAVYPSALEELVEKRYLRAIPVDPVADNNRWLIIAPPDRALGEIYDVKSAAPGSDHAGKHFADY
jgi:general secretion pathway protein G